MAEIVYIMCALTSLVCAFLLLRGYLQKRTSLLLWSSLCFLGLSLNNILLFVDLVIVPGPTIDLSIYRSITALIGTMILLFGLIWDTVG